MQALAGGMAEQDAAHKGGDKAIAAQGFGRPEGAQGQRQVADLFPGGAGPAALDRGGKEPAAEQTGRDPSAPRRCRFRPGPIAASRLLCWVS